MYGKITPANDFMEVVRIKGNRNPRTPGLWVAALAVMVAPSQADSWAVSYRLRVPHQTGLDVETRNGGVKVTISRR